MFTKSIFLYCVFLAGLMCSGQAVAASPDCTDFYDNHRLDVTQRQWCQALAFKEKYLKGGKFVEKAPSGSDGKARKVHSRLSSRFSSSGASSVKGSISIDELRGRFRLELASTSNTLYYGRTIKISGVASSGEGRLRIYSPIDIDLWKLAAVLVDGGDRNTPPPEEGLTIKGFLVTEIAAGKEADFSANLIPLGSRFYLLLHAPDGNAKDIKIDIDNK